VPAPRRFPAARGGGGGFAPAAWGGLGGGPVDVPGRRVGGGGARIGMKRSEASHSVCASSVLASSKPIGTKQEETGDGNEGGGSGRRRR